MDLEKLPIQYEVWAGDEEDNLKAFDSSLAESSEMPQMIARAKFEIVNKWLKAIL